MGLIAGFLGKETKHVRAVDGVSFDVQRGEVFCLVGESGCGKTTTGKALIAGVDTMIKRLTTKERNRIELLQTLGLWFNPTRARNLHPLENDLKKARYKLPRSKSLGTGRGETSAKFDASKECWRRCES